MPLELKKLLLALLQVYSWLIFARFVISWVSPKTNNDFTLWLIYLTEPVLGTIRRLVPIPGVDFSPLLAWLLIQFLMKVIAGYGN